MRIRTTQLDRAAFFMVFGGQMIECNGKYPENEFVLDIKRWVYAYELLGGWVPVNKFCNERRRIKRMTRKLAGLPEYFTGGKRTGFKLGDVATIRNFSKKEREYWESKGWL